MGYLWPAKANLSSGKASRCFLVSLVIPQPPLWAKTDNSDKGSEGLFGGKGVSRTGDTIGVTCIWTSALYAWQQRGAGRLETLSRPRRVPQLLPTKSSPILGPAARGAWRHLA